MKANKLYEPITPENIDRIKLEAEMRHPRIISDGKPRLIPLCDSKTGWLICGDSNTTSDFERFGLGLELYFKIIKQLIVLFLIIVIINIPVCYFYLINTKEWNYRSYEDILFKSTIANLASDYFSCSKIPLNTFKSDDKLSIELTCLDSSTISSINAFSFSLHVIDNSQNSKQCGKAVNRISISSDGCDSTSVLKDALSNCLGRSSCSKTILTNDIFDYCGSIIISDFVKEFYFVYGCSKKDIKIFSNTTISRSLFAYICVITDMLSVLVFSIGVILLLVSVSRLKKDYRKSNIIISNFTLHIQNIKLNQSSINLHLSELLFHLKEVIKIEEQQISDFVSPLLFSDSIESKYSDSFKEFESTVKMEAINRTLAFEINYPRISAIKLDSVLELNKLDFEMQKLKSIETEKDYELLEKLKNKMKVLITKINYENSEGELKYVKEIFITMRNQKLTNFFFKKYSRGVLYRCCLILCCNYHKIKHLYFKGKWLKINIATDEPSNIKWENITYHPFKRMLRKILFAFVSFLVILLSFAFILGANYAQKSLSENYNLKIECSYLDVTEEDVRVEQSNYSIPDTEKFYSYCYCKNYLSQYGFDKTSEVELTPGEKLCTKWLSHYLKLLIANYATVITIPIINSILILFLKKMTSYERNKTMSEDMTSNFLKIFIMQTINTGIIILLVNTYSPTVTNELPNFPILTGNFDDFTAGWFIDVGTTIMFVMIISIFTPHLMTIFFKLLRCCRILYDSGCNNSSTKLKSKQDYFSLYVGPTFFIEGRLAQIGTIIFVSLTYSSGMPLLYLTAFLFLILTLAIDKYLILRYYKCPLHFDTIIYRYFANLCFGIVVIHLLCSIWTYSYPSYIIDKFNSSSLADAFHFSLDESTFIGRALQRFTMHQNLILCGVLLFILVYVTVRFILLKLIGLAFFCKKKDLLSTSNASVEIGVSLPINALYKIYLLRRIKYAKLLNEEDQLINQNCGNLDELKLYYTNCLKYLREVMYFKLRKISNISMWLDGLYSDFDLNISRIVKQVGAENPIIANDFSYDLSFFSEFEYFNFFEMQKVLDKLNK